MGSYVSKIVFQPPLKPTYALKDVDLIGYEGKQIATKWIPYYEKRRIPSKLTVLYSHGNACDIGMIMEEMRGFGNKFKCNVVLWDYPGYGHSQGTPSEESITKAIEQVYFYYKLHLPAFGDEKIILMGTSLGSAATCHLASYLSISRKIYVTQKQDSFQINFKDKGIYHGVILECPISSVISTVLPQTIAYSSYSVDMFKNYWNVLNVDKPVFIIHGEKDTVVNWSASNTLARNLGDNLYRFWLIPEGNHNNLRIVEPENYYDEVLKFFNYISLKDNTIN